MKRESKGRPSKTQLKNAIRVVQRALRWEYPGTRKRAEVPAVNITAFGVELVGPDYWPEADTFRQVIYALGEEDEAPPPK